MNEDSPIKTQNTDSYKINAQDSAQDGNNTTKINQSGYSTNKQNAPPSFKTM